VKVKQKNRRHIGMAPNIRRVALVIPSNITVLLAIVMHFLYHSTATLLRRCCCNS